MGGGVGCHLCSWSLVECIRGVNVILTEFVRFWIDCWVRSVQYKSLQSVHLLCNIDAINKVGRWMCLRCPLFAWHKRLRILNGDSLVSRRLRLLRV